MKLREPATSRVYTIFLSSSDEPATRRLRDRVKRFIDEVITPALIDQYPEAGVSLRLQMWEQRAPQREFDGRVNGIFVEQARRCHFLVVLLFDEIREGTRQELEAVLAESDVQIAVLVYDRPGQPENPKQTDLLAYLEAQKEIFYRKCGSGRRGCLDQSRENPAHADASCYSRLRSTASEIHRRGAAVTQSPDERLLLAALLWDRPALVRSKTTDAQAFVDALDPTPPDARAESSNTPVGLAAEGIRLERTGSAVEAVEIYRRLAGEDGLPSLLGRCLLMWSAEVEDTQVFNDIEPLVATLVGEDRELHARVLMKLATYALDKQLETQFARWLKAASQLAPSGSHFRRAVLVTCSNLLDQRLPADAFPVPDAIDPLVSYEWIDDLALDSARAELMNLLKSRARSPWTSSMHFGRTNLDTLLAAERQATWAGALWMRDPIRAQLAAQILTSQDHNSEQAFYAVAMWLLSKGSDVASIINLAERKFSGDAPDKLMSLLEGQMSIGRIRRHVMAEAAAALCDLMSPQAIDRLLAKLPPPVKENASSDDLRRFWGMAALVSSEPWRARFTALSDEQKVALIPGLPPSAILALPSDVLRQLSVAITASQAESEATQAVSVVLSRRGEQTNGAEPPKHSPHLIVEIAIRDNSLVDAGELASAEAGFRKALESVAASAREGRMSFGGRTIPQSLAILAQCRGTLERDTIEILVSMADDDGLPGEFRLDILVSLASLSRLNLLSGQQLDALKTIKAQREPSWLESINDELLRAAQLVVRSVVLEEDEEIAVLTLSRNADARVREMICRAAGRFLSSRPSLTVESALLAALYDPEEAVLVTALEATAEARLTTTTDGVINTRLAELYGRNGRRVRAAAVRAAKTRLSRSDSAKLTELLGLARRDRSWRVRQAASDTVEPEGA